MNGSLLTRTKRWNVAHESHKLKPVQEDVATLDNRCVAQALNGSPEIDVRGTAVVNGLGREGRGGISVIALNAKKCDVDDLHQGGGGSELA